MVSSKNKARQKNLYPKAIPKLCTLETCHGVWWYVSKYSVLFLMYFLQMAQITAQTICLGLHAVAYFNAHHI